MANLKACSASTAQLVWNKRKWDTHHMSWLFSMISYIVHVHITTNYPACMRKGLRNWLCHCHCPQIIAGFRDWLVSTMNPSNLAKNWSLYSSNWVAWPTSITNSVFLLVINCSHAFWICTLYIYADVLSAQAYNWPHVLVKVVSSICTMMMQGNLIVFIPLNAITVNGLVYLG